MFTEAAVVCDNELTVYRTITIIDKKIITHVSSLDVPDPIKAVYTTIFEDFLLLMYCIRNIC